MDTEKLEQRIDDLEDEIVKMDLHHQTHLAIMTEQLYTEAQMRLILTFCY